MIDKLIVKNYKIFLDKIVELNDNLNIFVGENDSGKSTLLEIITLITTGKLNGYGIDGQLRTSLFNNKIRNKYIDDIREENEILELPYILIEAYLEKLPELSEYQGTNNSLGIDNPGIQLKIEFDQGYSDQYKKLLQKKQIYDIPIEFYSAKFFYFNGSKRVLFRTSPFKVSTIDTTRKDYSYMVNRFISDNISTNLSDKEKIDLSVEYRKNRNGFINNDIVKGLNSKIKNNIHLADKKIELSLQETTIDQWKSDMTISVNDTLFDNIGFGTQNSIKIELAANNDIDETNIILVEEPENNLSYGNMAKLISKIFSNTEKQIFISTHNSFIVNKLGLKHVFILCDGQIASLQDLPNDTMRYFNKLPGYDTLRLVLANNVILVEGPTDELLVSRAYCDNYGKNPIDDGVDIISVGSLAFPRFCEIAEIIKKEIKIITDNDQNIEAIENKYQNYSFSKLFFDRNTENYTIEISVLKRNIDNFEKFKKIISKKDSLVKKTQQEIQDFMLNNKTEWAMRVYESESSIIYPEHIIHAIK